MGAMPWGLNSVWVESCMGGISYGWNPMGGILCGWNSVWVEFSVGAVPLGGIPLGGIPRGWNFMGGNPWVESYGWNLVGWNSAWVEFRWVQFRGWNSARVEYHGHLCRGIFNISKFCSFAMRIILSQKNVCFRENTNIKKVFF